MGLDIYVIKTRHKMYDDDWKEVVQETENDDKAKLASVYGECINKLTKAEGTEEYEETAKACLMKLGELFDYPQYSLDRIGYGQKLVELEEPDEWGNTREWVTVLEAKPVQVWLDEFERIIKGYYSKHVGYFRKVNLLYAFFDNRGTLHDEYFSMIEKEDAEELIRRCRRVLENHELAEELLPTRSGFFFGGTDYDEWYFKDVEDVLKTFEGLMPIYEEQAYPELNDDPKWGKEMCRLFIKFSW